MLVYGHYIETLPPNSSYYPNTPIDEIENIRADDGKYVESNTSEYYAAQRFVFKGLRNDSYLTIIRWNGKGVCEC
ncbi:MAG TPA: hypothetical protein EYG81_06190, partial [Archaeoglobus profundus]|nr:hypothetical protein [Archaeoglobus profundus]